MSGRQPNTVWWAGNEPLLSLVKHVFFRYNARLAPVAQLDRVLGYEPRGQEFESLRARHIINGLDDKKSSPFFFAQGNPQYFLRP